MTETRPVTELVAAAARGDQGAWNGLVEMYLPLVMSVIRRYRLPERDAEDVSQTVWLRLVEHLEDIREPRALPMWIITTTKHEALHLLKTGRRSTPVDPLGPSELDDVVDTVALDDDLLRAERQQVLREGLAALPPQARELLLLLVEDPPLAYVEIGRRLSMPIGSIGPTRARCLAKLRETAPIVAFLDAESDRDESGGERHERAALGRR